ncbi:MAG: N-acetyltransferase [Deltaproteobacteria bacterium]|nr:N-acetyltransferase [Deltaproteobacteria bacterium]MCD6353881.1 N-acetyltransferase [Pseudomonadota bacterium]
MNLLIRKARIADVKEIHSLLKFYGEKNELLPRSLSELYDQLRDFFVCEDKENESRFVGACAMHICWEDIAEIRSLAVCPEYQGKSIGTKLVDACLSEAVTLGIYKVFVLTYRPDFFGSFGFIRIDKSMLPHKIWADCLKCPKFPDCDEIGMLLTL